MKILANTNTEFTFLILIDFSKGSYKALAYLIKIVKLVGGNIELFYIAEPIDVVSSGNIIAALRSIREEKDKIESRLNSLTEMVESEGIKAKSSYSFGNVEFELKKKLETSSSKIIVIGKIKTGIINKATDFLVNEYKGNLLLIGNECVDFLTGTSIIVACNNKTLKTCDLKLAATYSSKADKPLILLEIGNHNERIKKVINTKIFEEDIIIQYKNEENDSVFEGLKNHINSNNIELLCIGRSDRKTTFFHRLFNPHNTTAEMAKNIEIPLLIMGNNYQNN